jgi:SpoVK/Ycf46/Vps4 family AAA+-type ATPase
LRCEEEPRLKALDQTMVESIENEILEKDSTMTWDDIAGLKEAKKSVKEIIILPMMRPDLFRGIRAPSKGMLLFGPPGTGKTMIGKAIASECKSTFFSITASTLTSKWVGVGEKMVKTLFALAKIHEPSVVFIDEIDSILCARNDNDVESSRRIKTEFMCQLGGTNSDEDDKILIIGATNRPEDLDDAVRRRLEKRLYIPLPNADGRKSFITQHIRRLEADDFKYEFGDNDQDKFIAVSKGYSGADLHTLCHEAAMGPMREIPASELINTLPEDIRPMVWQDFEIALQ